MPSWFPKKKEPVTSARRPEIARHGHMTRHMHVPVPCGPVGHLLVQNEESREELRETKSSCGRPNASISHGRANTSIYKSRELSFNTPHLPHSKQVDIVNYIITWFNLPPNWIRLFYFSMHKWNFKFKFYKVVVDITKNVKKYIVNFYHYFSYKFIFQSLIYY